MRVLCCSVINAHPSAAEMLFVSDQRAFAARNYYQDLGLSFLANDDEVRQAFRRLALKHHPDRHPRDEDAAARFMEIVEAYEVLSDPDVRRIYDTACQYWLSVEEYLKEFGELLLTVSGLDLQTSHTGVGDSHFARQPAVAVCGLLTAA